MNGDGQLGQKHAAARQRRNQGLLRGIQRKERGTDSGDIVEVNGPGRVGHEWIAGDNRKGGEGIDRLAGVGAAPPVIGRVQGDDLLIPAIRIRARERALQVVLQGLAGGIHHAQGNQNIRW